ncbi:MAG: signal peptide peptidase SppA [Desulfobacterota bacterium]|nr:signal peptide peptidase SppA [Thermodesulfobacteriota bacterium]
MRITAYWLMVGTILCITGCAFVNVPLMPETKPLEETVIEGTGRSKVLIIAIEGVITTERRRLFAGIDNEPDTVARVKEEIEKAKSDKKIKALILKINSPGGTVTACDIIHKEILEFKKATGLPVIACLMDTAASGGYYIASAADTIIAHPTTITGSIGVIATKFNVQGLMQKLGIAEESIKSGDKKDILSPFRSMTPEEQRLMQDIINTLYQKFLDTIIAGRKALNREELIPLADGRVFTASQACDAKLVDSVGYMADAITAAKERAGIAEARVVVYHRPATYKNNIYSQAHITFFGLTEQEFSAYQPVRFMYLWNP